jgi:hypothetical protein
MTDGVLGQGMNTAVLVTTNEPLGCLHPAIARPGRCWNHTEFTELDVDHANRWLATQGSSQTVSSPTSLAELYALLRGSSVEERRRAVGFASA